MTVAILRRSKLGRTSCREITNLSTRINKIVRSDQPFPEDVATVIRWGTTSNVPVRNVVNTAEAIHRVNNKTNFRRVLMEHWANLGGNGNPLCPYTYTDGDASFGDILNHLGQVIVRPSVHAQGRNIHLVSNAQEFAVAASRCGPGWYASKYINKVAEYRVAFVQGRVAWVARKTPGNPQDVAWNVARGGRFDNVRWDEWPLKAVRISREAFNLSDLDFGGVDVMVDNNGDCYVLEINSAPSLTSPYRQECMAKCFDYLIEHGKNPIPVVEERGGWKKFIHPALSEQAIMV